MRFAILFLVLAIASCGSKKEERINNADISSSNEIVGKNGQVSRQSFETAGLLWPLISESGRVGCTELARWIEVDGIRYGINGLASVKLGYQELEKIWAIDEKMMAELNDAGLKEGPTLRISLSDLSSQAGTRC